MQPEENGAKFLHGLITLVLMVFFMFSSIVFLGTGPQVPLIFGCLAAGVMALVIGYSWNDVLKGMLDGIIPSLEAILILMLIGMLVGTWIAAGTMPTMIYYGLMVISPKIFLPAAVILCTVVAFAIGSWGTVGTIGLAFMGIGSALGLPAPLVAGAVISGAYAGEMVSPLSDATNLASAVVRGDVFEICGRVVKRGIPAMIAALVIFTVSGIMNTDASSGSENGTEALLSGIEAQFDISPLALIPVGVMAVCLILKMPAIPAMLFGAISGMVCALTLQHYPLKDLMEACYSGYKSDTGNDMIDSLLSAGGIEEMFYTISIIIIAMAFGGIMTHTGQMKAVITPMVSAAKGEGNLTLLSTVSTVIVNIIIPDQYLGVSLPGEMYADTYKERGISKKHLATSLLGGGVVTSPLIPWNTCGLYCTTILGVATGDYMKYCFFCLVMPIVTIISGYIDAVRGKKRAEEVRHD